MTTNQPFSLELHQHRFAAWAASRAASVKGCRFSVKQGRAILEQAGFDHTFAIPEQLPAPDDVNLTHRQWRDAIKNAALTHGLTFTDGVAAKLINVYLKSKFINPCYGNDPRVAALHPPIDDTLLKELGDQKVGGLEKEWRKARRLRWSKLDSDAYERLIDAIKSHLGPRPLWEIEEYWKGNQ